MPSGVWNRLASVDGLLAENNHHAGEAGQRRRDLCSRTKSFAWFHDPILT